MEWGPEPSVSGYRHSFEKLEGFDPLVLSQQSCRNRLVTVCVLIFFFSFSVFVFGLRTCVHTRTRVR